MQIDFKGTNYELQSEITALAQKKVETLGKYLGRDRDNARAYIDLGKESEAHQNGKFWRTDISVDSEGTRFYAKAVEDSMEKAIDKAVAELGTEIRRTRRREQSLVRKGGGVIKSWMRGLQG